MLRRNLALNHLELFPLWLLNEVIGYVVQSIWVRTLFVPWWEDTRFLLHHFHEKINLVFMFLINGCCRPFVLNVLMFSVNKKISLLVSLQQIDYPFRPSRSVMFCFTFASFLSLFLMFAMSPIFNVWHVFRFGVWEAAKWVARVRESTIYDPKRPILLNLTTDIVEENRYLQCKESALETAFLIKMMESWIWLYQLISMLIEMLGRWDGSSLQ